MCSNSSNPQAAVIQMVSGNDITANLEQAQRQLLKAKEQGAQLVLLPENFAVFGKPPIISCWSPRT